MAPSTSAVVVAALALLASSGCDAFVPPPSAPQSATRASRHRGVDAPPETSSLCAAYIDEDFPRPSHAAAAVGREDRKEATTAPSLPRSKPPRTLPNGGRITLVGAGPGSPDLLTVAAHRIITDPDNFIIVDRLVSDEILELIEGEYRVANKHPGCQEKAQDEIFEWCKEGLNAGRHVVRLKIGESRSVRAVGLLGLH